MKGKDQTDSTGQGSEGKGLNKTVQVSEVKGKGLNKTVEVSEVKRIKEQAEKLRTKRRERLEKRKRNK